MASLTFKQYLAEQGQLDEFLGFGKKDKEEELMKKRLALRNQQRGVEAKKASAKKAEADKAKNWVGRDSERRGATAAPSW